MSTLISRDFMAVENAFEEKAAIAISKTIMINGRMGEIFFFTLVFSLEDRKITAEIVKVIDSHKHHKYTSGFFKGRDIAAQNMRVLERPD